MEKENESIIIVKQILWEMIEFEFLMTKQQKEKYLTNKETKINSIQKTFWYNLIILKTINQQSGNLCGFYAIFNARQYIKYAINNNNEYYLHGMNSFKKFFNFHRKIVTHILKQYPHEKEELNQLGSLERYHMDYIIKSNLLVENKINILASLNIKCYFLWFSYSGGTFSGDKEHFRTIEELFTQAKKVSNDKKRSIYFFLIALSAHWILLISDNYINRKDINLLLFDSYGKANEVFTIQNNKEAILQYIDNIDRVNHTKYKMKKMTEYDIKAFTYFIEDYKFLFNDLSLLLSKIPKEKDIIPKMVVEYQCKNVINSYENLIGMSFEKLDAFEDKMLLLMMIYNWLLTNYHPKILSENIFEIINYFKLKSKNNSQISKYILFCKKNNEMIKNNLNLIFEKDIIELLLLFMDLNNKIIISLSN